MCFELIHCCISTEMNKNEQMVVAEYFILLGIVCLVLNFLLTFDVCRIFHNTEN